jgi:hypothetical protein
VHADLPAERVTGVCREVEAHFQRSYQVLGVTSRVQAILKTREAGLLRK